MRSWHSGKAGSIRFLAGAALAWTLVSARGLASQDAAPGAPAGVAVEPAEVVTGLFYSGTTVHVSAVVPGGAKVAIVCRGQDRPLVLKKKGKVLGLIWMNVGRVEFRSVPGVYLLRTSDPVERLAPEPVLEEEGVGLEALSAGCGLGPGEAALFGELCRLQERDGVWRVSPGTVRLQPARGGVALATTDFELPARAGPGTYGVQVYTFTGGLGRLAGSAQLTVREGGGAALVSGLATRHRLLYGILAATAAVAVGLLTGLVFGLGSKH